MTRPISASRSLSRLHAVRGRSPPGAAPSAGEKEPVRRQDDGGLARLPAEDAAGGMAGRRRRPDRVGKGGDIVSLGEYENFELTLDWKIAPGGNSGIFYRVVEQPKDTAMWEVAPEYQLIDDTGYPGVLKPTQKTAANYDLQPPGRDATRPAGSWNTTRILVNGSHVEHWLNGVLIVVVRALERRVEQARRREQVQGLPAIRARAQGADRDPGSRRRGGVSQHPDPRAAADAAGAGRRAGAVADSRDAPADAVGVAGDAGSRAARVSAAAAGSQAVDESERHVELRDHGGRCAAAVIVRRPHPRPLRDRIAVERRRRVGAAGPDALVPAHLHSRPRAPPGTACCSISAPSTGKPSSTSTARRPACTAAATIRSRSTSPIA